MTLLNGIRRLNAAFARHGPGQLAAILLQTLRAQGVVGTLRVARGGQPFLAAAGKPGGARRERPAWPPQLDADGAVALSAWTRWLARSARPSPESEVALAVLVADGADDPERFRQTREAVQALDSAVPVLADVGQALQADLVVLLRPGDVPTAEFVSAMKAAAADPAVQIVSFDLFESLGDRVRPLVLPGPNPALAADDPCAYGRAAVRPQLLAGYDRDQASGIVAAWCAARSPAEWRAGWRHVARPLVGIATNRGAALTVLPADRPAPRRARREGASAIICTRDKGHLARQLVRQLLQLPSDQLAEIVILANGSSNPYALRTLQDVAAETRVRVVRDDAPFNFSRLCNAGVRATAGRGPLLFLNDDVAPVSEHWLEVMLARLAQPAIGSVGALLLYPNEQVQHAGMYLRPGGAGHYLRGAVLPGGDPFGLAARTRDVLCSTGAALLTGRQAFVEIGGFDEKLAISFQDVDYGLKLHQAGWRNVFEPRAVLLHMESVSLANAHVDPALLAQRHWEKQLMTERWASAFPRDPFWPAELDPEDESLHRLSRP